MEKTMLDKAAELLAKCEVVTLASINALKLTVDN